MDDDIKRIEDYLLGTLTEEEIAAFHSRLESDKIFREKFEFEQQLFETLSEENWSFSNPKNSEVKDYKSAFKSSEFSALKQTIAEAQESYHKTPPISNKNRNLFFYVAAASVAIFIVIQFLFNQPASGKDLYYAYVNLDDLPGFVTRNDVPENQAIKAQRLFENKEYEESIRLFEYLLESQQNDARLYLYLGLAHAEYGDYTKAENVFDDLIASELIDAEKGYWYKALLFLKMEEKEKALQNLRTIKDKKSYNFQKAEELIDEIE